MAKLKRGAKSAAVREYFAANPDAMPKDVIAALKSQGIKVSAVMVSTIKGKLKGGPKKRGRKKKRGGAGGSTSDAIATLIQAKKFAEQAGGIDQAQEALAALAKLG